MNKKKWAIILFLAWFFGMNGFSILQPGVESANDWFKSIRAQEDAISDELYDLQVSWLGNKDAQSRKKIIDSTDVLEKSLLNLQRIIDAKRKKNFDTSAGTEWLNVAQQLLALQDLNNRSLNDLRDKLSNKNKFSK